MVGRLLGNGRHQPDKVLAAEKSPLFMAWSDVVKSGKSRHPHLDVERAEQKFANDGLKATFPGFVMKLSGNTLYVATTSAVFGSKGIAAWRMSEAIEKGIKTGDWAKFAKQVLAWSENQTRAKENPHFPKVMKHVVEGDSEGLEEWVELDRALRILLRAAGHTVASPWWEPPTGGQEWVAGLN